MYLALPLCEYYWLHLNSERPELEASCAPPLTLSPSRHVNIFLTLFRPTGKIKAASSSLSMHANKHMTVTPEDPLTLNVAPSSGG